MSSAFSSLNACLNRSTSLFDCEYSPKMLDFNNNTDDMFDSVSSISIDSHQFKKQLKRKKADKIRQKVRKNRMVLSDKRESKK
ncbi:hypothetical protein GCM10009332_19960 [Shewanella gelidii]|uniref:Uncharacterized protein n=1 Tax=Shewanella gelidii TaxID=1642821 RepID=A0A917JRH8_9GAMM|nr:hypothetical protein GCM10009332_19960 [Shewanella gelidii]